MRVIWSAALMILALPLAAQVTVEVEFRSLHYLANEELFAAVRITNFSGRTLHLGGEKGWLRVEVEADDGHLVEKLAELEAVEAFEIPNASRGTRWVNLEPLYDIARPGRYLVTASVDFKDLHQTVISRPSGVNIIAGATIWAQRFGLPRRLADGTPATETRKYSLIQSSHQRKVSLYVRVTDEYDTQVFRVFPLGPVLTFSRPEARVDRAGNLHVLFQVGARNFSYSSVRPDGELAIRRTYQYAGTRPQLRTNKEGYVEVVGGLRVPSSLDLPGVEATAEETNPKKRKAITVPAPTEDDAFGPVLK